MNNLKRALLVACGSSLSTMGVVHAADGTQGSTSTGTSTVTMVKSATVQITGVDDIDLGTEGSLGSDKVVNDAVCVYSTSSNYNITLSGSNTGFQLDDGGGNTIAYTVTWNADGAGAVAATSGTPITGLSGDGADATCGGSTNAVVEITVAAATFNAALAGSYSDTLTMLIAPE